MRYFSRPYFRVGRGGLPLYDVRINDKLDLGTRLQEDDIDILITGASVAQRNPL